jgi:hypothetical protein
LPVVLAIARREEPVSRGHEGRETALHSEELVHRIIVKLVLFALDLSFQIPFENVGGELLGIVLLFERIGVQLRQVVFREIEIVLLMRRGNVTQPGVMAGNPEPLDEADGGEQLWLFEENLRENLFVKQVQAPGAEPNEIDEKDRQDHHEQESSRPPIHFSIRRNMASVLLSLPRRGQCFRPIPVELKLADFPAVR